MNPVISTQRFFESEELIDTYNGMTCWLLYSDMHKELWQYVRENWSALDEMTNHQCLVCLMDQPTTWEDPFWSKAKIRPEFDDLLGSKPFDRNAHFQIARSLGVKYAEMPALVFFPSVRSEEKLIIKIDKYSSYNDLTATFSAVFDCVNEIVAGSPFANDYIHEKDRCIWARTQCMQQLEPLINRRKIASFVKRLVTPTSVIGAAQVAASL